MTYTIRLVNCAFFARHGVLPEEARLGQRFFVDAALTVEPGEALASDEIAGTVHYGEVFETIEAVMTGPRRNLIEVVANDIGAAILARFGGVLRAEITVRKPSVPIEGILDHAEVTVVSGRVA